MANKVCRVQEVAPGSLVQPGRLPGQTAQVGVTTVVKGSPARGATAGGYLPGGQVAAPSRGSYGDDEPYLENKRQPMHLVKIGGIDVKDTGHAMLIKSVEVRESCGRMSMAKVVFSNPMDALTDDSTWDGQPTMEVWTGFAGTTLEKRSGIFQLRRPKFRFMENGLALVEMVGFDESYRLAMSQKRRKFENMTDGLIASQIARDNNLAVDIDWTDYTFESVIQANESDMQFLSKRAQLYGYELTVKDGVLNFHAPRYEHSGVFLVRKDQEGANLKSFDVSIDQWFSAVNVVATQIDPISKERIQVSGSSDPDDVSSLGMIRTIFGTNAWNKLVEEVPDLFMLQAGHDQHEDNLQKEADGWAKNTRFLVSGTAKTFGMELVHAGQIVTILNVGKFSGDYLVSEAIHRFDHSKGYQIHLQVKRSWLEKPQLTPSVDNVLSRGSSETGRLVETNVAVTGTARV
jgi:phage protein D